MKPVKFYKVSRGPRDLPEGPQIHWGLAAQNIFTGETMVLHNTPYGHEHLGTLEEFHCGMQWMYEAIPYSDEIYDRFIAVSNNPNQYDLLTNNCQHTFTGVVEGHPWSPLLSFLGL